MEILLILKIFFLAKITLKLISFAIDSILLSHVLPFEEKKNFTKENNRFTREVICWVEEWHLIFCKRDFSLLENLISLAFIHGVSQRVMFGRGAEMCFFPAHCVGNSLG